MIGFIAALFASLIPLSILKERDHPSDWQVRNGVLDLAGWHPQSDPTISLAGEWEFYWNRLLSPNDFKQEPLPTYSALLKVPSTWNGLKIDGHSLPGFGAATYRMVIKNLPVGETFALKKTNIRFSSTIYVNGRQLLTDGHPASDAESYRPGNVPQIGFFTADRGEADIIVQVANYDYFNAGIPIALTFGEQSAIIRNQQTSLAREFIAIAILATFALIHLACFAAAAIYRKSDRGLLLLALFCLLFAAYQGLTGERALLLLWPFHSFETLYKLKDICSFAALIVVVVYFRSLQRGKLSRLLIRIYISLMGGFLLMIPFVPIRTYTTAQPYFIILYELMLVWLLYGAAARYISGSDGQRWRTLLLFLAILTINLYSVEFILFAWSKVESLALAQLYIIIFNAIMLFLVVLRFFEAYHTVDAMKDRLLELDQMKDEFLTNTSRELQHPLSAIVNISDTLLRGAEGPVTDRQARSLALVMGSGRQLMQLVNGLLDYSQIKHGTLKLLQERIDLKDSVDSVLRIHLFFMGEGQGRLENRIPPGFPAVLADGSRLTQMLHHLIGHAIIRAGSGGVDVSAQMADSHRAEITVSVFGSESETAAPEPHADEGDVLRLNIAQKLAELQGGELRTEPSPGRDVVFRLVLPVAEAPASRRKAESTAEVPPEPALLPIETRFPLYAKGMRDETILLADDDVATLQAMFNLLRLEKYSVVAVNRGQLALKELAGERSFDLALLGVTMPDMTGYEVLRNIRERFSLFELPVLMITDRYSDRDYKVSVENGANDLVGKPFGAEELLTRVRSLIRLKSSVQNAKDTEIAFLRSQIKPHFLFNALNSIAELCVADPGRAEEVTLQLSTYLRSSFDFKQLDSMSTLRSELELLSAYVSIEKARFGSRLRVEYEVDVDDPQFRIPPLIVQPLVENAIRHGVMSNSRGGTVKITVQSGPGGSVLFSVADDGRGLSASKLEELLRPNGERKGVGLWNIRQRIRLLYGQDIRIESLEGKGTTVSFTIPGAQYERTRG